jgi:2-oxoglutarate dehydrogenase E1 component/2-oxoglutarate decarboxylase
VSTQADQASDFGANEWYIQELYQDFVKDPESVPEKWRDFLADYHKGGAASPVPAAPAPVATATPVAPAPAPAPAPAAVPSPAPAAPPQEGEQTPLKGAAARVVTNMEASLEVPTATSVRAVPAKLLADNRTVINNHLRRARGGKVSFTHLIGYALVKAVAAVPVMNTSFAMIDGKPNIVTPGHVGLGLAIDLQNPNGSRSLVVAAIKGADQMDFAQFHAAYEDIVRRARNGKLTTEDFQSVTISLTNPGGIGTVHSVPRLMQGQGAIIGVGAMEYPAEFQGASEEQIAKLAISKIITLTSTYDHRVIQGAQSGEFLRRMHELLLGDDGFYDEVFASLRIPYEPVRWVPDVHSSHEGDLDKATRVNEMIHAYRVRGHLLADTDPLNFKVRTHPDLDVVNHGLTLWDLDREFPVGGFAGNRVMKLRDVLGVLRDAYCRNVGIEYMHIQDPAQRRWIQERVEKKAQQPNTQLQLHVLKRLNAAEAFESFLHTKFVNQKRFSLEGGESVIPMLDAVLNGAATVGLDEVVIGMAHRGRLNVLANIVGKSYGQIFREFEGNIDPATVQGSGDVKYHLGATGTFTAIDGTTTRVSLTSNPSHLEAVDPVLEGIVRAKQDLIDKGEAGFTVLPVLLHGDAAFAGQGVVAETLQMGQLRGYRTGGTVHVIINNQVGFTTAPESSRSSTYCTDVARTVQAPIFHVNGDDPEACVRVALLAFEFRQEFKKDVVIDLVCYRRRGHNEGDDPSMTQPLMYDVIDNKRSVRKIYTEQLVGRGDITIEDAEDALKDYQAQLERVFAETRDAATSVKPEPPMTDVLDLSVADTAVEQAVLDTIGAAHVNLPEGFTPHPKVAKVMQTRAAMATQGGIDWGFGEILAFGSLLLDGIPIRLAGQDTRRGTFTTRHATLIDQVNGDERTPLRYLSDDQATFHVYDSLLSEFACLGFEYGYSVARPEALVLWEAQFGDFVNGAMTIIDEFISSGEAKWGQRSGVTLLLPHGYEGQGPDHSSTRIERFLQLCAEDNMTVAYPSTPAQHFHLLRAQAMAGVRRPLIVATPKSMLRNKAATSEPAEFTSGRWQPVLADPEQLDPAGVTRVVLCSGKVFYDLAAARRTAGMTSVALVRVEQLYPVPGDRIREVLATYPHATDVVWAQEEPANQGAWSHMALSLPEQLPSQIRLRRISRRAAASPAAGSHSVHEAEQRALVDAVLSS